MRRIGAGAGLELQLDAEGVCGLGHASGIDCAIEVPDSEAAVYLRAPIVPWPPARLAEVAERCLTGQFLGLGTAGAGFAIDPRDRELVLWQCLPLAVLDEAAFGERLATFIDMAARWREEVLGLDRCSEGGATAGGAAVAAALAGGV